MAWPTSLSLTRLRDSLPLVGLEIGLESLPDSDSQSGSCFHKISVKVALYTL